MKTKKQPETGYAVVKLYTNMTSGKVIPTVVGVFRTEMAACKALAKCKSKTGAMIAGFEICETEIF